MAYGLRALAVLILLTGPALADKPVESPADQTASKTTSKKADKAADKQVAKPVALTPERLDDMVWAVVGGSIKVDDYGFYEKFFPQGAHAEQAHTARLIVTARSTPPPPPALPDDPAEVTPPFASDAPWIWILDRTSNCWAKNRAASAHESIVWTGKCRNGKIEGFGVLVWRLYGRVHEIAIGNFVQGGFTGTGVTFYDEGERDEGVFQDGLLDGHGVITFRDGRERKGTFAAGKLVEGRWTDADGSYVEGHFVNGKLEGTGLVVTKAYRMDAEFRGGEMNGHTRVSWTSGTTAEGESKDNRWNGHVVFRYSNHDVFEAEFAAGERKGPGVMAFADGRRLACVFDGAKTTGDCTYTLANGEKIVGPYVPPKRDIEHSRPIDEFYPPLSRRFGETGRVQVSMTVLADGRITDVALTKSSGYERLDEAAVQAVAASYVYHPATVAGHPITDTNFTIAVEWRLNDEAK